MPDYLTSNRRAVASALWAPFSWIVQALVYALIIQIISAIFQVRATFAPETVLLFISLLPIAGVVVAAVVAFFQTRKYQEQGRNSVELFLRGFIWFFSFPARGWIIGFGWALKFMIFFAVTIVICFIGLLITWWAISTMISFGANGWLILLVGIGLPGMTIGGAAWGNQHGSGTTGGTPVGCILFVALVIPAAFLWFILLVAVLALFALPASIVLITFNGGRLDSMEWEFSQWATALGAFVVLVVLPFTVDKSSRAALGGILDKLPFVAKRRETKRILDAARGAALIRQAEERRLRTERFDGENRLRNEQRDA